jgi:hypothetical protein
MQVSDAHLHRQNRRRSASVTRSSATPPRRASSSSSSDTADAGAADDGDYELEERSAGNTPRRRSATSSRAISPAAPRMGSFCCPLSAAARHAPTIGGPSPPPGDPRFAGDRGSTPTPTPDLPGIGGPPLPLVPRICQNRGSTPGPTPGSNRGFRALLEGVLPLDTSSCQWGLL